MSYVGNYIHVYFVGVIRIGVCLVCIRFCVRMSYPNMFRVYTNDLICNINAHVGVSLCRINCYQCGYTFFKSV